MGGLQGDWRDSMNHIKIMIRLGFSFGLVSMTPFWFVPHTNDMTRILLRRDHGGTMDENQVPNFFKYDSREPGTWYCTVP